MQACWCYCCPPDLFKLVGSRSSRKITLCTDYVGFIRCNFWRLIMMQETGLLFVEDCLTGFEQLRIRLYDCTASNNQFPGTTSNTSLCFSYAISSCNLSRKLKLNPNIFTFLRNISMISYSTGKMVSLNPAIKALERTLRVSQKR